MDSPAPTSSKKSRFDPHDVLLVIEVVSPESAHRDRVVKLDKYAQAGIPHYWRVERDEGRLVVHVYELDGSTLRYAPVDVVRDQLVRTKPFPIDVSLANLV